MTWKKIEIGLRTRTGNSRITLLKSKSFRFNNKIVRENKLLEYDYVLPSIDENLNKTKIAFLFLKNKQEGVLKVSKIKDAVFISGASILRALKKDVSDFKSTSFSVSLDKYEGKNIMIIEVEN